MTSDRFQGRRQLRACAILFVVLAALGICGGDGARQLIVRTEDELHAAIWDADVTDIVLVADIRVRNVQLSSQQLTTDNSPRPPPPPLWVSQPVLSNRPVPIGRPLKIRGDAGSYSFAGTYPTSPFPDAPAASSPGSTSLRLPLLDLTAITGWLRLLPNASLTLQGLHLAAALSADQPDLQPYRPLLRALLASPPATAMSTDPGGRQQLLAVSLEGCLESVNVGLPQSLGEAAVRALPPLPDAVAAAAAAAATAASRVGAWATLPSPPAAAAAVELQTVAAQLCLVSLSNDSSSNSGTDSSLGNSSGIDSGAQGLSKAHRRRAQAAHPSWPLERRGRQHELPRGQGPLPCQLDQGQGQLPCQLDGQHWGTGHPARSIPVPVGLTAALCWLAGLMPAAPWGLAALLAAVGVPHRCPGQHALEGSGSWREAPGGTPGSLPRRPREWVTGRGGNRIPDRSAGDPSAGGCSTRGGRGGLLDVSDGSGRCGGRMALSQSNTAAAAAAAAAGASSAAGLWGAVCLGGGLLVDRAVTAMAFPVAGGSLVAVTDDILATAEGWANKSVSVGGGSSSDYGGTLLLLMVASSYSASSAQVDEACLRSANATLAACVQRAAAAAAATLRAADSDAPPPSLAPAVLPPLPPPALQPAAHQDDHGAAFQAALWAVLAVAVVLLLALAALLWLYRRLRRRHNRERGAKHAPGVGPLTTLLITDIANSTGLWESLPEEVMDQALKLHHACLRALLQRFNGYESATEGDSFILAFHYPADAARFALSAQVQLMDVMWPAEVLAHPDGQEVWVVPRPADMSQGTSGTLPSQHQHQVPHTLSGPLSADMAAGAAVGAPTARGASMSVQRSSGAGILAPGGGAAAAGPQRASDVGYSGYGGAAAAGGGGGGGFLRASWITRPKSFKGMGPSSAPRPPVPAALLPPPLPLPPGMATSVELDRLSGSELDTEDLSYREGPRTGSGMLRSFTSRMTTMLGLSPPGGGAGGAGGGGAVGGGSGSGRPSSRMVRFLRFSATLGRGGPGVAEDSRPPSAQGYADRPAAGRLQASLGSGSGSQRHGGAAAGRGAEMSRRAMRSKSFGGRLLAGQGALPPRSGAAAAAGRPSSGSGHGVAAGAGTALPLAAATASAGGSSFTSGARSLLRQALSFHCRQVSFRGPSRAAAEAAAAAAASAGGGAAAGATPATTATATTVTASSTGLPASVGSPDGSRVTGSYQNLPPYSPTAGDTSAAAAAADAGPTRRAAVEGAPLHSRDASVGSVTGGGGGGAGCAVTGSSVSASGKGGGMFRNGLRLLGRGVGGGGAGGGAGGGGRAGSSASGLPRPVSPPATMTVAAVEASMTSGPSSVALATAVHPDGRRRRSGLGGSAGTIPRAMPPGCGAPPDAAQAAQAGRYQRRYGNHTHSLYGDVVAGVAYGRAAAAQPRMRSSYDGSLAGGALIAADETARAAAAAAVAASATVDIAGSRGGSAGQAIALNTAYESEIATGQLFASVLVTGSSGASGAVATDDANARRRLSNATAALVMDVFEAAAGGGVSGGGGGSGAARPAAPRVPHSRSTLVVEAVHGDGGGLGLSVAALQRVYMRRFSAPAYVGGCSSGRAAATPAADGLTASPPLPQSHTRLAGDAAVAAAAAVATDGSITATSAASGGNAVADGGNDRFGGSRSNIGGDGSPAGGATPPVCSPGGGGSGAGAGPERSSSLARRLRGSGSGWPQPHSGAAAADAPRRGLVVTHNQLYCSRDDSGSHVRLGSAEPHGLSDSLRLLPHDVALVPVEGEPEPEACQVEDAQAEAAMRRAAAEPEPDPGGTAAEVAAAEEGAAGSAAAAGMGGEALISGEGSGLLPVSVEIGGSGSGREGPETTSTNVGGSGSIGMVFSGGRPGGPRSLTMLHSRVVPSPSQGVFSQTSAGALAGGGGGGGGSSFPAALARLMRSRGRDVRVQSSPAVRMPGLDAEAGSPGGGGGSGALRAFGLAPIREPSSDGGGPRLPLQLYARRNIRACSSGPAPSASSPLRKAVAASAAASGTSGGDGGGSASAGQLHTICSIGGSRHGGSGGASASPGTAVSPPLSRTGSMTVYSVSQTVARGWSRANTLVKHLTRDRSVRGAAARRSAAGNGSSLDYSLGGAGGGGGGAASSGGIPAAVASGGSSGGDVVLAAASALLAASDAEPDSGAELSAIGIITDAVRSRMAACGSAGASASGQVAKMHAGGISTEALLDLLPALALSPVAAPGAQAAAGDAEGGGRHYRLSNRMVTIDLGAALAATVDEDNDNSTALPPPPPPPQPGSAKSPPRPLPLSAGQVSAAHLLTASSGARPVGAGAGFGGGGGGSGGVRARGSGGRALTGPVSGSPPLLLPASGPLAAAAAAASASASAFSGAASRRISFLGLVQRSRNVERHSTEEWQASQGDVTGAWHGSLVSQTAPTSQPLPLVLADCRSWREKCREEWPLAVRPAPPARCAYRGLRVRMGLHTGITTASDVTFNPTTSHMAYGGTAMKLAKAVGDAAAGGMILMSQSTFQALVGLLAELPGAPQAVFSGESNLSAELGLLDASHHHVCVYQLVHRELVQRMGYAAPLRNIPLTQLGTEDAPTGFCAISFMHVASASMLVAELGQPGVEALQQFKSIATELCSRCGGYVVEASEGLCLAAFRHAAAALVWALASREALANHPWSAEVRRWYRFALANSVHNTSRGAARGPRPRTGVHVGGVNVEVNAATGRMTYRGKVMNRTSRIAHKATSEQIVCSKEAWDAVHAFLQRTVEEIQEERRREEEALRQAAAAAAAAARAGSFTAEAEAEGEDEGYDDMLAELSPTATPSLLRQASGLGAAAVAAVAAAVGAKHGSPPSSRGGKGGRGGSGGSKPGSAPSSARSLLGGQQASGHGQGQGQGQGQGHHHGGGGGVGAESAVSEGDLSRIKASSLAASLAASVRAHRSASAKHLSAAAAAAAAISRRVTSFTTRLSSTSLPDMSPSLANGVAGRAPSATATAASGPGNIRAASAAAALALSPPTGAGASAGAGTGTGGVTPPGPVPQLVVAASPTGLPPPPGSLLATGGSASAASAGTGGPGPGCLSPAAAALAPTATQSSVTGPTGAAAAAAAGGAGSPQSPAPSLQWLALSRLVGPKVQLPAAKRLEARYLGSYSLKGVREEMKLFEVFWAKEDEEEEQARGEATVTGGGAGGNNERGSAKAGGGGGGGGGNGGGGPARRAHSAAAGLRSAATAATSLEAGPAPSSADADAGAKDRLSAATEIRGLTVLPRMVAAADRGSELPFSIASAAQLGFRSGFAAAGAGGASATAAAAASPAVHAQPVSLSRADFWRGHPVGAKSDWPVTDTLGSCYEEDVSGTVLQQVLTAEELAAAAAAAAPSAAVTFEGSGGGGGGGGGRRLRGSQGVAAPVEGEVSFASVLRRQPGGGDSDVDGGGGGDGGGGRSQRGSAEAATTPPRVISAACPVLLPGPGEQLPPSLHHLSPYGSSLPQSQQQPQQPHLPFPYPHPQLHPQPRPGRPSLRPEQLLGGTDSHTHTPSPYRSPSTGTSPIPGVAAGADAGSGGHRRRHPAGGLGVTFADLTFREQQPPPAAATTTSSSQYSMSASPAGASSAAVRPSEPGQGQGQRLDSSPVGLRGADPEPTPAAGASAGAAAERLPRGPEAAAASLRRPLSAPTPVRVLQPALAGAAADDVSGVAGKAGPAPAPAPQPQVAWAADAAGEAGGPQGPEQQQGQNGASAGPRESPGGGLWGSRLQLSAFTPQGPERQRHADVLEVGGSSQRHGWEAAVPLVPAAATLARGRAGVPVIVPMQLHMQMQMRGSLLLPPPPLALSTTLEIEEAEEDASMPEPPP